MIMKGCVCYQQVAFLLSYDDQYIVFLPSIRANTVVVDKGFNRLYHPKTYQILSICHIERKIGNIYG